MGHSPNRNILTKLISGQRTHRHSSAEGSFKVTHPKEVNAVSLLFSSYCLGLLQHRLLQRCREVEYTLANYNSLSAEHASGRAEVARMLLKSVHALSVPLGESAL